MQKCDFNKVALQLTEIALLLRYSPINLVHVFRIPFPKSTSGWLLLSACIHSSQCFISTRPECMYPFRSMFHFYTP